MKPINKILLTSILFLTTLGVMVSCNKNTPYSIKVAESKVHFVGAEFQKYSVVVNPPPAYTVTVGTTDKSDEDRTVTFEVTSPTGLVAGTDYTLGITGNTLTIPAGQTTTSFSVQANASSFPPGQKDTLMFVLKQPSTVEIAGFLDTLWLALRGPCAESDLDASTINDLAGTYTKTYENGSYGPYNTTISGISIISPTSAKATITRIYDYDAMKADVIFDWSVPGNYTVSVVPGVQLPFTVGGVPLFSGPQTSGALGSFEYCDNKLTVPLRLYTSNGTFDEWVMTMAR